MDDRSIGARPRACESPNRICLVARNFASVRPLSHNNRYLQERPVHGWNDGLAVAHGWAVEENVRSQSVQESRDPLLPRPTLERLSDDFFDRAPVVDVEALTSGDFKPVRVEAEQA